MPPKRRANNTHKKRRSTKQQQPHPEHTGTPHTSPSKTAQHTSLSDCSPSPTPLSQPLSSTPDHHHQADLHHASKPLLSSSSSTGTSATQNSTSPHDSLSSKTSLSSSSAKSIQDSSTTLTERSTNLPDSTASYSHPNSTNEAGRPASKSSNKHASPATHGRAQDPGGRGENQTHLGSTAKSDAKKTPQPGSHSTASAPAHHAHDLDLAAHHDVPENHTSTDEQPSAHHSRAHNGVPNEPRDEKMEHGESEKFSAVKEDEKMHTCDETLVKEDHLSSKSSSPTAAKKPAKHVKFTSTSDPAQASHFPTAAEGPQAQTSQRKQQRRTSKKPEGEEEEGDDERGGGKSIRREMSGAADAFDFDAQQRLHAGPGGGLVKKARHRRANGHQSSSGEWSADEVAKDSAADPGQQHAPLSSHPVHGDCPARKDGRGFQHAQRSLRAAMAGQRSVGTAPPPHHEDDTVDPGLVQMYLSFFDQDQDGLLAPLDSWRAFRRLGFGVLYAAAAAFALHALITPFLGLGSWRAPDLRGRARLPLVQLRRPGASRHPLHVHPHNLLDVEPGRAAEKVGPRALWKKTQTHMGAAQMTDPVGWIKFLIGWMVAVGLTWPADLSVNPALINGVYNGELLFIVADQAAS